MTAPIRNKLTHLSEFIIDALVNNISAVDARKLVIMPVDDQSVDDQVLVAVVVPLYDKVLEATQSVAVGGGEVSFGTKEVVMPVYGG